MLVVSISVVGTGFFLSTFCPMFSSNQRSQAREFKGLARARQQLLEGYCVQQYFSCSCSQPQSFESSAICASCQYCQETITWELGAHVRG